jgi:6-phosphofructo-2-kinase/fructose-2,6-biphosphatase 4
MDASAQPDAYAYAYIQLFDGGSRIVASQVRGFLPTKMLFYLMNLRHARRTIYLCQPDARIAPGLLAQLLDDRRGQLIVWSDVGREAARLTAPFDWDTVRIRATLGALNPGQTEGLAPDQVRASLPEEYRRHVLDPYHHRYPRAESYHDLVIRLEPIIMELERDPNSILILADASVLRCIYAYFIEASPFLIPGLLPMDDGPAPELVVLQPEAYGCHETRFSLTTGDESLPRVFRQYTYLG